MARGRWPLYYTLFAIFVAVLVIALVAPSPWSGIAFGIGLPGLMGLLWWARPPGYNPFAFGFTRKSIDETRDELIASAPEEGKSETPPSGRPG
jgi:hypothetical protein